MSFHPYNTNCGMICQFSSKQISYTRVMHCQLTSDYYVLTALYFHVPKPPPFRSTLLLQEKECCILAAGSVSRSGSWEKSIKRKKKKVLLS